MISDAYKALAALDNETPNAYTAFCDYVEMGYARSLPKLAEKYNAATETVPTLQLTRLKIWSSKYEWQRRINDYQLELAATNQMNRVEAYSAHIETAIPMAENIMGKLQQMLDDFQRQRITRRVMIDDPRDAALPVEQRRQIESIQTKVNVGDLQKLVATFGSLNKDLRTALGLPNVTEVKGVEPTIIKTYIGVSPDDWDEQQTPALPASLPDDDEIDPVEVFD